LSFYFVVKFAMSKVVLSVVFLGLLVCCSVTAHEFSSYFAVTWDSTALGWRLNDAQGDVSVAANTIALFNITESAGTFFLSSKACSLGINHAYSRADNVTNNACTPPCVIAAKLSSGTHFFCSSLYPDNGFVYAYDCAGLSKRMCSSYVGCGYSSETSKCTECIGAKTSKDCDKISGCAWCKNEEMCLHENSTACRAPIPRERAVASWVWLLITVCALVVLIAVVLTLFLSEASFKSRWAAMAKVDTEFAEVGRGTKDGLSATD